MSVEGGSPSIGEASIGGSSIGSTPGPGIGSAEGFSNIGSPTDSSGIGTSSFGESGPAIATMDAPGFEAPVIGIQNTNLSSLENALPGFQTLTVAEPDRSILDVRTTLSLTDVLDPRMNIEIDPEPVLDMPLIYTPTDLVTDIPEAPVDAPTNRNIPLVNISLFRQEPTVNHTLGPITRDDLNQLSTIVSTPQAPLSQEQHNMDNSLFVPIFTSQTVIDHTGEPFTGALHRPDSQPLGKTVNTETSDQEVPLSEVISIVDNAITDLESVNPEMLGTDPVSDIQTEIENRPDLDTPLVDEQPQRATPTAEELDAEALRDVRAALAEFIEPETIDSQAQITPTAEPEQLSLADTSLDTQDQIEQTAVEKSSVEQAQSELQTDVVMTSTEQEANNQLSEEMPTLVQDSTIDQPESEEQLPQPGFIQDEETNNKRYEYLDDQYQEAVESITDEQNETGQTNSLVSETIPGIRLVKNMRKVPEHVSKALREQGKTYDPTVDDIAKETAQTTFDTNETQSINRLKYIVQRHTAVAHVEVKSARDIPATEDEVKAVFSESPEAQTPMAQSGVIFLDDYRNRFSNGNPAPESQTDEYEEIPHAA